MLRHREVTGEILRAYFEVWNHTPRIYPEHVYESGLQRELALPVSRQARYDIFYKEVKVGQQELDLLLSGHVVIELKAVPTLTPWHMAQTISYIKVASVQDGLLLNFGSQAPEYKRLFYNPPDQPMAPGTVRRVGEDASFYEPELVYELRGVLFEVFHHLGPGFVHRIYANAVYREGQFRGLPVVPHRTLPVQCKGQSVCSINLRHLQTAQFLLFPIAHTNPTAVPLSFILQTLRYHNLPLAIVANFQTTHLEPQIIRNPSVP